MNRELLVHASYYINRNFQKGLTKFEFLLEGTELFVIVQNTYHVGDSDKINMKLNQQKLKKYRTTKS